MKRRPPGNPALAVGYLRISTDAERQANGLEVQRQAIEAWARGARVQIVAWFRDERSGTAKLDEREGLGEALAALDRHGAGVLVVHRIDRFARDTAEGLAIEAQIKRLGAQLVSTDEGERPPGDDPSATFQRQIRLAVAEYEGAITRIRIRATKRYQREQGRYLGGRPPYGYTPGPSGELVPLEPEQATIVRLAQIRARSTSLRQTAQRAEKEGLRNRQGRPFGAHQIGLVLGRLGR